MKKLIVFKGGEGSGRYPAGSGDNDETSTPSSASLSSTALRERVSKLDGVSRAIMPKGKPDSVTQASLDADKVKIVADDRGQQANAGRGGSGFSLVRTIPVGKAVDQVQKMIGMHPADLRDVIFANNQIPENDISGTPQIDFKVEKISDKGITTLGASVMTKQVEVNLKIESDKAGNKTMTSNVYVPLAKGEDHTPINLAMMSRVSRNIKDLAKAMGITNIVQTKEPTRKAEVF
jgi:hypothetical protein